MDTDNKVTRKSGRPVKPIKKESRITIRFSKAELFIINEKAANAGMHASAYVRQIAIHARIKPRLIPEERHYVRQLIGMANNLNQLAKLCHQEGVFRAVVFFENYRQQIDHILQKLKP